jgi:hypothetical protein
MKLNELIQENDLIHLDDFLEKKCHQFLNELGDDEVVSRHSAKSRAALNT